MKAELDKAMKYLPQLTKEEADLIEDVCKWTNEQRSAYILAKNLFEEADE